MLYEATENKNYYYLVGTWYKTIIILTKCHEGHWTTSAQQPMLDSPTNLVYVFLRWQTFEINLYLNSGQTWTVFGLFGLHQYRVCHTLSKRNSPVYIKQSWKHKSLVIIGRSGQAAEVCVSLLLGCGLVVPLWVRFPNFWFSVPVSGLVCVCYLLFVPTLSKNFIKNVWQ